MCFQSTRRTLTGLKKYNPVEIRPTPFAHDPICPRLLLIFQSLLFARERGLSNGGLRPLAAICAQSSQRGVHFYGPFGPLSKGNFCRKMATIVGNRGQLWTSILSPHLLSPHLVESVLTTSMSKRKGLLNFRCS